MKPARSLLFVSARDSLAAPASGQAQTAGKRLT